MRGSAKIISRSFSIRFGIFLAVIIILADHRQLPAYVIKLYAFPYGDRLGHFLLYGLLTLLLRIAFPRPFIRITKYELPVLILCIMIFIEFEEISQRFIPSRSFSLTDLGASLAGWGLGWWIARKYEVNPRIIK